MSSWVVNHVLIREYDLVGGKANCDGFFHLGQTRHLLQEHARHDGLEVFFCALERDIGHGKAVRVGGNHAQALFRRGNEHARKHGAALVFRHDLRHALHHAAKLRERHFDGTRHIHIGERREVSGVEGLQHERRLAA